jgi:arachidonate 15-lipoxygenase
MLPTLPQQDPDRAGRRAALAEARARYPIARAYRGGGVRTAGSAVAAQVPKPDQYDAAIAAKIMGVDLRLVGNHAALEAATLGGGSLAEIQGIALPKLTLGDALGITRAVGSRHAMFGRSFQRVSRIAQSFPVNDNVYREPFVLIPKPAAMGMWGDPTRRDRLFAWERIAGANPLVLQGIRHVVEPSARPAPSARAHAAEALLRRLTHPLEALLRPEIERLLAEAPAPRSGQPTPAPPDIPGLLPARFPVTSALYRRVLKARYGVDDDLLTAAAEARLYLADYRLIDGLPQGTRSIGALGISRQKTITAPMALFVVLPATDQAEARLVPVCIQCHQTAERAPGGENPIFTPLDGARWEMAKATVQCANATHHEMVWHLGRSHMVMEGAYLCARHTLAARHPLMILLAQHCEFTLAINDYATKHLVAPGGQVDLLFGATLDGTLTVMDRALDTYDLMQAAPPSELAARLVLSTEGLPDYPYRDDALTLWPALERWVSRYVGLYYGRDEDVRGDAELQAFVAMLGAPEGGNFMRIPPLESIDQCVRLIATLCWIGSAQHSAVNYTQFPYFGFVPSSPLALYAAAPTAQTPDNMANFLEMLCPTGDAVMQADIAYQLSSVRWRALGDYAPGAFLDPRVGGLLRHLRAELKDIEAVISARDQHRFMPYPYLLPSQVQTSIFI